jgi:hypothetical protein
MKKTDLIVMILLAPLAVYLVYVTIMESWTRTDQILMIVFLAGGVIAPPMLQWICKSKHGRGDDRKIDPTEPEE